MEIKDSIVNFFKTKASSTLLVSFSVFYVITHIEGFYTTLFVGQDFIFGKYQMLKNEYVFQYFFGVHFDSLEWWLRLILPFLFTYLYVWWLPKIVINPGYKVEIKYKVDRKIIKMKEEERLLASEGNRIEQESKNTDAKIKLESKKKELDGSKADEMEDMYRKFVKNNNNKGALDFLSYLIYHKRGYTGDIHEDSSSLNNMMLLDINGLIETNEKNSNYQDITDKGRAFLRLYSNEKNVVK